MTIKTDWTKELRNVYTVKDMARSKYFWLPLFAFISLLLLFSDNFMGIREVSVSKSTGSINFSTSFDLNLLKIVEGIALLFILLDVLKGKGRQVGGCVCLFVTILCPANGAIPVVYNEYNSRLPVNLIYILLFLSCWYILTFYSHFKKIPLMKLLFTFFWITVFLVGIWVISLFLDDMKNKSTTFLEILENDRFILYFVIGLVFILFAVTFLWKDISNGEGLSIIFCDVLYWSFFILPSVLSLYSIWGYVSLLKKTSLLPSSRIVLNWVIFSASSWILILFRSMYKHREKCSYNNDLQNLLEKVIPKSVIKRVLQIPIWLFFIAVPMFIIYFINSYFV